MHLLALSDGGVSLEFSEGEFAGVKSCLRTAARRLGLPSRLTLREGATLHELRIGGQRFVLSFEDGDPCLIAVTADGGLLLHAAAEECGPVPLGIAAE